MVLHSLYQQGQSSTADTEDRQMTKSQAVVCFENCSDVKANGFIGYIKRICDGHLDGMVEIMLPGGLVCISLSQVTSA
jgi:hypothetical protein